MQMAHDFRSRAFSVTIFYNYFLSLTIILYNSRHVCLFRSICLMSYEVKIGGDEGGLKSFIIKHALFYLHKKKHKYIKCLIVKL